MTICVNSHPRSDNSSLLDDKSGKMLVAQAQILNNDYGKFTSFIHNQFSTLLSVFSEYSSSVLDCFIHRLDEEFASNDQSSKTLSAVLKPWTVMASNVISVDSCLIKIGNNLENVQPKFRPQFSTMLRSIVLNSFQRDIPCFRQFLKEKRDKDISKYLNTIDSWNEKNNSFTWSTQIAFQCLRPTFLTNSENKLAQTLEKFLDLKSNQQINAVQAILTGFRALVLSNNYDLLHTFMNRYYKNFYAWYLKNNKNLFPTDKTMSNFAYIDFPLAVLFYDPPAFDRDIVKLLMDTSFKDYNRLSYMSKVIQRFCNHASVDSSMDNRIMHHLFQPCTQIFTLAITNQNAFSVLENLTRAFQDYPAFMRELALVDDSFFPSFFKVTTANLDFGFHYSLIAYFDPKLSSDNPNDDKNISIYTQIFDFLLTVYQETGLYQSTQFTDSIPQVANKAAEFISMSFENQTTNPPTFFRFEKKHFHLLYLIEALAIIFLGNENINVRKSGVSLLKSLLDIVNSNEYYQGERAVLAIDQFHGIVSAANTTQELTIGHPAIRNNIKTISDLNEGTDKAFVAMFEFFLVASNMLSPNLVTQLETSLANDKTLPKLPNKKSYLTGSRLIDAWTGAANIIFGLQSNRTGPLLGQLGTFLADMQLIGDQISQNVPALISINSYKSVIEIILSSVTIRKAAGSFDPNSEAAVFVKHALKFTTGLMDQLVWNSQLIRIDAFEKLIRIFVNFCDQTTGEDFKLPCSVLITHMCKMLDANDRMFPPIVRHQIATQLLTWLPRDSSGSKLYFISVLEALKTLLDNLDLMLCADPNDPKPPQEQATNAFKSYSATVKTRIDSDPKSAAQMVPMLCALLKQNLTIGITDCLSMGLSDNSGLRDAFLSAIASVFHVPEAINSQTDVEDGEDEDATIETPLDVLFKYSEQHNYKLVEIISAAVPYSRSDKFGAAIVEGAISKHCVMELLAVLTDMELSTVTEENQNTIFRGNAVPAKAVGHYPRVVGTQWMTETLRPAFEDVIKRISEGESFDINPNSLGPDKADVLDDNRKRFGDLIRHFIDIICAAREKMPIGLIKEAQLIHSKVSVNFGAFAIQILSGFLFLRFLLPAFTVPKMVGMGDLFPDGPRQVLTLISTILMSATLHGNLDGKPPHVRYFNDIAAEAHDRFFQMFQELTQMQSGELPDDVTVDLDGINSCIRDDVWPLKQAIKNGLPAGDTLIAEQYDDLMLAVNRMGAPKSKSAEPEPPKEGDAYDALMSHEFSQASIEQMEGFLEIQDKNKKHGPEEPYIILMDCRKLKFAKEPQLIPYMLMDLLKNDAYPTVKIVCLLTGFDESFIPSASYIAQAKEFPPAKKIKQWVYLEPSPQFINFAIQNQQFELFSKEHDLFPKSLQQFTQAVGTPSQSLPSTALETLTVWASQLPATVEGKSINFEFRASTVQIVYPESDISNDLRVSAITNINAINIESFQRRSSTKFNIILSDKSSIEVTTPENSSLLTQLNDLSAKVKTMKAMNSKIKIEASSIQWLMINLSLINMINEKMQPSVHKASVDLLDSIINAFNLEHNYHFVKTTTERLPLTLLNIAVQISEDLAKYNSSSYWSFINEYCNIIQALPYLDIQTINISFSYLGPWIKCWDNDPNRPQEFVSLLTRFYREIAINTPETMDENFWPNITSEESLSLILNKAFQNRKSSTINMITSIAACSDHHKAITSKIIAGKILSEIIEQNQENMVDFALETIMSLLISQCFDFCALSDLIYNVTRMRLFFKRAVLLRHTDIISNIINVISIRSGLDGPLYAPETVGCFASNLNQSKFRKDGEKRPWLSRAQIIGQAFANCLGDEFDSVREELYVKFEADYNDHQADDQIELRAQSMVYMGCFAGPHAREFTQKMLKIILNLNFTEDDTADDRNLKLATITAVCLSLSCLKMDETLSVQLAFIGVCLALYQKQSAAMDLVGNALKQYQQLTGLSLDQSELFGESSLIPQDLIGIIEETTELTWSQFIYYTLFLMIAQFCDNGNTEMVARAVTAVPTEDTYYKLIRCIYDSAETQMMASLDYGPVLATIEAAALLLFKHSPGLAWDNFLENIADMQPSGFASFDSGYEEFAKGVAEAAKSAHLVGLIVNMREMKGGEMELSNLIACNFDDIKPVELSDEEIKNMISVVFPECKS